MQDEAARRAQMIETINEAIVQQGFAGLTMDQIAKMMGVSRGKLYQYFPSKDAVITAVVEHYFKFMDQQNLPGSSTPEDFVKAFPAAFLKLATLVASSSAIFRKDLAQALPERAQAFAARYNAWIQDFQDFIRQGQEVHAFNASLVPGLFCIQVEASVPAIMDSQKLLQYQLAASSVLQDYLQMTITQVIAPQWQDKVDLGSVAADLRHLTVKYQRTLRQ